MGPCVYASRSWVELPPRLRSQFQHVLSSQHYEGQLGYPRENYSAMIIWREGASPFEGRHFCKPEEVHSQAVGMGFLSPLQLLQPFPFDPIGLQDPMLCGARLVISYVKDLKYTKGLFSIPSALSFVARLPSAA